jgi:transcription elongation factor GreA-like protein/transcription elongation GreA/GreB family factor
MEKGNMVFHPGGWGTGEVMEVSPLREQVTIEFENVPGQKHLNFASAFKSLIPLPKENFLARRFADPDDLEKEAKENPLAVIKLLLKDLGPRTASEVKDDLCELVIPEKDWTKWWQGARAKIKKDPIIEAPDNLRDPFRLRKSEITHEERLKKAINDRMDSKELILSSYNLIRDLPNAKKNQEILDTVKEKMLNLLESPDLPLEQELQVIVFLESAFNYQVDGKSAAEFVQSIKPIEEVINAIEIIALKKRVLTLVKEHRADGEQLFLSLLFSVQQSTLKDYILKEVNQGKTQEALIKKLKELIKHPMIQPETLVWYFQKLIDKEEEGIPFHSKEGQCQFFEALLILFSQLDGKAEYKDLAKKIYNLISGKRYAVVRQIIEGTDLEFIKEFLLLVSKCQNLSDHDIKIMRSLAEVVHPSLAVPKTQKGGQQDTDNVIWMTEEGHNKIQERIKHIGTVEVIENAREIEAARALGDLRENSEYKFAQERRHRLQGEMKTLSQQLSHARIITKADISSSEIGVGNTVELEDSQGKKIQYTILGPWEANPDENILSFQSKLALEMAGCKIGEKFKFRDEEFTIISLKSYLDK